jgi:hypothetical protein
MAVDGVAALAWPTTPHSSYREKAIQFLQETRRMTRKAAAKRVKQVAAELGMNRFAEGRE